MAISTSANPVGTVVSSSSQQYANVGQGPALYVPGNAARVAASNLWGPSLFNLDLGLKRAFPIYREAKLQFEVDALNALNHVVFSAPSAVVNGGSSFGTIGSVANTARDFQLSARIQF